MLSRPFASPPFHIPALQPRAQSIGFYLVFAFLAFRDNSDSLAFILRSYFSSINGRYEENIIRTRLGSCENGISNVANCVIRLFVNWWIKSSSAGGINDQ